MKEKVLDIEIHHDTCQIVAHIDGSSDPMECKNEIMDLLEDLGYFVEGKWTLEFKVGDDDPNAKQRLGQSQNTATKRKETN